MNDRNGNDAIDDPLEPLEIAYTQDFSGMTNVRRRWWRTLNDCGNKVCMISSAMMNTICCGGFHNKNNDSANDDSNDRTNRSQPPCDENRKENKFGKCRALLRAIIGCIPLDENPRMLYGLNVLGLLATYWATADSVEERFDEAKMERHGMNGRLDGIDGSLDNMRKDMIGMNEKLDGVLELLKQRNS